MNKKMFGALVMGLMSYEYAAVAWLGAIDSANRAISLEQYRPWVYRQLVPSLARLLVAMGVRVDWALIIVMTVAGVGFYLALHDLAWHFYRMDERTEILLILLVGLGLVIFNYRISPTDTMTAWLWTLAFLFTAQEDDKSFLIVFVLACINRETTFLMIWFSLVVSILRMDGGRGWGRLFWQSLIFIEIQGLIHFIFRNNGGLLAWVGPIQNLHKFANDPGRTLLHMGVTAILLLLIFRHWFYKPHFFRLMFVLLITPLDIMYLVLGQAFEVRVFWEIYPIMALLILPTLWDLWPKRISHIKVIHVKKISVIQGGEE